MNSYQIESTTFFSNDRNPQIPASLNSIVHEIEGLNSLQVMQPMIRDAKPLARTRSIHPVRPCLLGRPHTRMAAVRR